MLFKMSKNISFLSLEDFHRAVSHLSKESFAEHVNAQRHDVYELAKHGFKDHRLAADLLQCHSQESVLLCLQPLQQHSATRTSPRKRKVLKLESSCSLVEAKREDFHHILHYTKEVFRVGT